MNRTSSVAVAFAVVFAVAALLLPGTAVAGDVTLKGSDTMVILGQRWAEEFMKTHPEIRIQVTGGGSGTGISALINGTADICQSSREMKDAEKQKLKEKYSSSGAEVAVAKDGVTVFVNAQNPIRALDVGQLKAIFTGKVTNWKDLGGPDKRIVPYSRESSSGTYVFFKEAVLSGADYAPRVQTLPGTAAVVNAVSKEKFGIGYGGAAFAKNVRALPIASSAEAEPVPPDPKEVVSGRYPLARDLYFYLRNEPAGEIGTFVSWVLSPAGQKLAEKAGYFPVK